MFSEKQPAVLETVCDKIEKIQIDQDQINEGT